MQNNFDTPALKEAKSVLSKKLDIAKHLHEAQKDRKRELEKEPTFWMKIKYFFFGKK